MLCGSDSVVECHLAKVKVAGPNPVSRSISEPWITQSSTRPAPKKDGIIAKW